MTEVTIDTAPQLIALHGKDILIPALKVAAEFGICRRTLARWFTESEISFPQPTRINGRLYFSRAAIEDWKNARVRNSVERGDAPFQTPNAPKRRKPQAVEA